jgi:hypothetical protein
MDNLDGIKIYVLGPPRLWDELKKETGRKEESYDHNKHLSECNTFAEAIFNKTTDSSVNISPFDDVYITEESVFTDKYYKGNEWRRVDHDWLYSAGSMALRINSITNNLSLALAIEFEESGRVLLFPGDAEYGNWASWHKLDWGIPGRNKDKHLTEDLLNRTVFYKVAHHLSHNGTAKHLGLEMMNHPDLVAMATLDYDAISPIWKGTMPNRAIVQDLLSKCKGRLLIMNEENLFYDEKNKEKLSEKIKQARTRMNVKENFAFKQALTIEPIYIDFIVKAGK